MDYTELTRVTDADGTVACDGNVDGVDSHFRRLDSSTPEGLATYRCDPEMD